MWRCTLVPACLECDHVRCNECRVEKIIPKDDVGCLDAESVDVESVDAESVDAKSAGAKSVDTESVDA